MRFFKLPMTLISLLLLCGKIEAQYHTPINSLKSELNTQLNDSLLFEAYKNIFRKYYPGNLDSARYYANQVIDIGKRKNSLELKIKGNHLLSNVVKREEGPEKALQLSKEMYDIAKTIRNDDLIRISLSYVGRWYAGNRQYDSAAYFKLRSLEIAEKMKLGPNLMVDQLTDVIYPLRKSGKLEEAFQLLLRAEKYIEQDSSIISASNRATVYEKFRSFYSISREHEKAIAYSKKALKIRQQLNDLRSAGGESYLIGVFYYALQNYDEARKYLTYASKHYTNIDKAEVGFRLYSQLGYCHIRHNQYEEALDAFKHKRLIANNLQVSKFIADAHCSLGETYLHLNQPLKAKETLLKAVDIYNQTLKKEDKSIGDDQMYMIYHSLARADSTLGNFKSGMLNYSKASKLKDAIYKKQNQHELKEMQVSYETEKKNKEIELLNEKNSVAMLSMEKQRQSNVALVIISILLILLIAIVYNRYRSKKKSMEIIRQKSKENEVLVQEIHHRVKNNLQIMLSLLSAESQLINDCEAKKLVLESQNRIKSMALIHKNLYQSGSLAMVQTDSYFDEIATNILSSFDDNNNKVSLKTNIASTEIKMTMAVPLGLILNELLTNSMKYAFEDTENAELEVNFERCDEGDSYRLLVKDNGKGLPKDFDLNSSKSFGLQLVEGLINQLNGSMQIVRDVGTSFNIYIHDLDAA